MSLENEIPVELILRRGYAITGACFLRHGRKVTHTDYNMLSYLRFRIYGNKRRVARPLAGLEMGHSLDLPS